MSGKIVFYNDSAVYGGHEIMFLAGLSALAKRNDCVLYVFYSKYNTRLAYEIRTLAEGCANMVLLPLDIRSRSFQAVRSFFMLRTLSMLKKRFRSISPDLVVLIQGNIEISSLGLIAARRAGFRCVSYIPMVNMLASAKNIFFGIIKYPFISILFRLPYGFITISDAIAAQLQGRVSFARISVVHNGVDYSRYEIINRDVARRVIGLPAGALCIGVIGRISFAQKGHDLLVSFARAMRKKMDGILFVVVGSGPDEEKLRRMVSHNDLEQYFEFIPWTDKMSHVYSSLNALLIPSRYEGFPVVAIEALKYNIPILVSSEVVSLQDMLPAKFFFKRGNHKALLSLIKKLPPCSKDTFAEMRKIYSAKRFPGEFSHAILECMNHAQKKMSAPRKIFRKIKLFCSF
jgi:glycosyltransferase involved in cell wall biosynthesis